jgi:hypothetical protein
MYEYQMLQLAVDLKIEDLAEIKMPAEPNPIKGERTSGGAKKGGKPPVDYTAVELLVDMKSDLIKGNYRAAYQAYVTLKRLTNA